MGYIFNEPYIDWSYFNRFNRILEKYMQPCGEGDNKASQAVTAVNKLVYKWYNDGDVYDNSYYMEGWWNDLSSYANWLSLYLDSNVSEILDRIVEARTWFDYELILKDLADYVLNEDFLISLENQKKEGSIYNCRWKFVYVENYDEDEDLDDDDDEED